MKMCNHCHQTRPLDSYSKNRISSDGLQLRCKDCDKEYGYRGRVKHNDQRKLHYQRNREKHRANSLYRRYGISIERYDELYQQQNGRCKICAIVSIDNYKRLAVDHDHITGEVRGLLCIKCNGGLGIFRDDISLLLKAVEYLAFYQGRKNEALLKITA